MTSIRPRNLQLPRWSCCLILLVLALPAAADTNLQLVEVGGDLTVNIIADTPTFVAYFHVPIANADQVPLWIEVSNAYLIDYRFVATTPGNVLVAARMRSIPSILAWRAWVMVDDNRFEDLPGPVPMTTLADLPDSVLPWLQATDTAQVNATIVQETAADLLLNTPYLLPLANKVCTFCYTIPWDIPALHYSFDAFTALTWGSSCTGHAHAATALCRALGIPARTKLVIPSWYSGYFDMHWSTDYYVPGYGWVRMEPSINMNPCPAQNEVVMYTCDPADEFPLFRTNGIDCFWHTSNPELPVGIPGWGGAHFASTVTYTEGLTVQTDLALSLARSAFTFHTAYQGIILNSNQQTAFAAGCDQQVAARDCLLLGDLAGTIANLESAVASYEAVGLGAVQTCYETDFEGDAAGWTHGGAQDEWELGIPILVGPPTPHSGAGCWGTDLDGNYEGSADAWLLSPPIDLSDNISAFLEFWVWNRVWDIGGSSYDPLWLDITTDGSSFVPLCSKMGGGNDDQAIPVVGGWAQMNLDLTPHVGSTVQIRFRFQSDVNYSQAGSYIDDVRVYGRRTAASSAVVESPGNAQTALTGVAVSPNPFNPRTRISFTLDSECRVKLAVYDLQGKKVLVLADRLFSAGLQNLAWDGMDEAGRSVPSGTYLLQVTAGESSLCKKLLLLR